VRKYFSLLRGDKKLYLEFALVFTAFLIMVLLSSILGARIVNKNVASYGNEVINSSAETLKAYLEEFRITLDDIAYSVETLKGEDAGVSEIHTNIIGWTDWLLNKEQEYQSFISVYGVVDDEFIDGTRWVPPGDYVPQSRSWYIGALEENGGIYYSDPYEDARTGEICLTVSKLVYDKNGKPFGVLAIDVFMTTLTDFVGDLRLMDSGYGLLLDTNRAIVVHPDSSLIGMRLEEVNDGSGGYAEISSKLAIGQTVSAFPYTTYSGVESVAFFKKLFNGWYIGVISPSKAYYNDVATMRILLSVAGFILMTLLCVVLAFLHIGKKRSDEANKMKTSFLANMSHEIRTPMNAILGMSELLLSESLSHRQQGYVNDINTSSHSLLSIINDILDLSKIEAGKLELNPVDYDFHIFMDNICSMFKFVAQKKGLEFEFESVGEMPKCLFGDDIRLRQVLTNICGNAVKFTGKGYIRLVVTAGDETLTFEIKDTGMGIRKEDIPKLFDPFSQADAQKNRGIVGTGLGLPISKTFVEMMGGKISVESVYGQGTSFIVTIPKTTGNADAIRYENKGEKGKPFFAPSARILVVDDNELNLKVACGLLRLHKIDANTALSGKEAIGLIKDTDFDIVFMDHMMPEMDGVETTAEIRKLGGKYKQLTIIALTANAVRGAKEMFIANGFDGFVSKPIEVSELDEILRYWLPAEKINELDANPPPDHAGEKSEAQVSGETHESSVAQDSQGSFLDTVKKINGVNTEIGMSRVSGMEDMYRETLEIFQKKLISECEKMNGFLHSKDLHNLAISVHGMKSSLATIGAMELSEAAFALETASKNEELPYCEEHLPGFLERLRSLHEELSVIMPAEEAVLSRPEGSAQDLRENAQAALAAVDDFDGDLALEAVSKLLEYDFGAQCNTLLDNAKSALADFDFEAAAACLNKLIELEPFA